MFYARTECGLKRRILD